MSAEPTITRARRARWRVVPLVLFLAGVTAIVWRLSTKPVDVVHPVAQPVVQSIAATGRVYGRQETSVAPEQMGVLEEVLVREGERVEAGTVLARLVSRVPQAEVAQAEAAVRTAEAQLEEARAGARGSEVREAEAQSEGAIAQAEARLRRAEERLAELHQGGTETQQREVDARVREAEARVAQARREVRRAAALADTDTTARAPLEQARAALSAAQAQADRARAVLADAERTLERTERLYNEGAVPRLERDNAATAVQTAREDLQQAIAQQEQAAIEVDRQQRLLEVTRQSEVERAEAELEVARNALAAAQAASEQVREPARPEVIAQQQQEVAAARAELEAARNAGPARVETIASGPREEQIAVAERRLEEARTALDVAETRLRATEVEAPFAGVVTEIVNRPGAAVGPGQPVLVLSQIQEPEVRVEVDERHLPRIKVGQDVVLTPDAYPDRSLQGKVTRLGAYADPQRGTVEITIRPNQAPQWLRTGLTVDANIILARQQRLLVLPVTAIRRVGDRATVYVVEKGHARERRVATGESTASGVVVLSGLRPTDWVVVRSASVRPGQRVRPVPQAVTR